jgi:hypothetical protein
MGGNWKIGQDLKIEIIQEKSVRLRIQLHGLAKDRRIICGHKK